MLFKRIFFAVVFAIGFNNIFAQESLRTIHVFVALCDNEHQGIVPVPARIGNGKDPANNLYWGAGYGVKNYFKNVSKHWKLIKTIDPQNENILERVLFKHVSKNVYLLADAYDGAKIKNTIIDFLDASSGKGIVKCNSDSTQLSFGGKSNLLAYIGHDGLMDFDLENDFISQNKSKREVIILACYSKAFFKPFINSCGAYPLLWSTHLMSPEAYTLGWALDGWVSNETNEQIKERAAQAYNYYQKCGIKGARNLLVTGW